MVNEKFNCVLDYFEISNYCKKIEKILFGKKGEEFYNLIELLKELKEKDIHLLYEMKISEDRIVENLSISISELIIRFLQFEQYFTKIDNF